MEYFVGIDIGKRTLDVALLPEPVTFRVPNDEDGWQELRRRLPPSPAGIVVEATSTYHVGVVLTLQAAGLPVAVMNPQRTAAFRTWAARHAKTDRHDARTLAAYAQQQRPAPTPLPDATLRELRELLHTRQVLVRQRIVLKNQLETATATSRAVYERLLATIEAERTALEARVKARIAADAVLAGRQALLESVPGIGLVLGAQLVAGLPELGVYPAKAIASLAGVAPHPRDSGQHRGQRRCVGGRRQLAMVLYQVAITAVRCEPTLRAHYRQLRTRHPHKVAIVAVARRLLGILTVMVRDGLKWMETRVGQGQFLPQPA